MDATSNSKVIPKTLGDLIREELEKDRLIHGSIEKTHNDYEVWPEDQGDADHKRNPYSRV